MHVSELPERKEPLVQLHPAHAEWVLLALVRAADVAVEGHRDAESELGHLHSCLCRDALTETAGADRTHRTKVPTGGSGRMQWACLPRRGGAAPTRFVMPDVSAEQVSGCGESLLELLADVDHRLVEGDPHPECEQRVEVALLLGLLASRLDRLKRADAPLAPPLD